MFLDGGGRLSARLHPRTGHGRQRWPHRLGFSRNDSLAAT